MPVHGISQSEMAVHSLSGSLVLSGLPGFVGQFQRVPIRLYGMDLHTHAHTHTPTPRKPSLTSPANIWVVVPQHWEEEMVQGSSHSIRVIAIRVLDAEQRVRDKLRAAERTLQLNRLSMWYSHPGMWSQASWHPESLPNRGGSDRIFQMVRSRLFQLTM